MILNKFKNNIVHYLWIFILCYSILSMNFGFPPLGNIIFIIMIAISVNSWNYIARSKLVCFPIIHKTYMFLYIYNILLFLIGLFFIADLFYFKFYVSFFINILLFSTFYYFNVNIKGSFDFIFILLKYVMPLYFIVLLVNYSITKLNYNVFNLSLFTILYLFVPLKRGLILYLLIAFSLLSVLLNIDYRALILLNIVGLLMYVLRITRISTHIIKYLTYSFLALPICLIIMSITIGINPFTLLDNSSAQSFSLAWENIVMAGDSRSFLYKEVYDHLCKYNAILWGTTPGIGYQSSLMNVDADFYSLLKNGRILTEVGILEFFHFGGIINVTLLFLVFVFSTRMIFKYAQNRLSYVAALYLSIRWFFLFMEGDISMSVQWLGLFVVLGFFANKNILSLSDKKLNEILINIYKR